MSLTNCPFCGTDKAIKRRVTIDGSLMMSISCMTCGCIGPQFFADNDNGADKSTTLWNEREEPIKHDDSKDNQ